MKRVALLVSVLLVLSGWAGFVSAGTARAQQVSPPQEYTPPQQPLEKQRTPRETEELRADLLMARKRYSEALAAYLELLKKDPKNAVLLNKIGIAYHQQMMLGDAKRYYDKAIKQDKTYAPAYNNVGTVHYNRKKYGSAIKAYKKAIEIRDDSATVHSNLGYAYFAQKKYEEAFLCFHRALELDPQVFERRGGMGSLLQDRTVEDRRLFFFFLAKAFATQKNAERCAFYLKKALDEGFNLSAVPKDPAFVSVVNDPQVVEVLRAAGVVPPAPPPSPPPPNS
jgi:tetratricopeptide (TPR) repeat protein